MNQTSSSGAIVSPSRLPHDVLASIFSFYVENTTGSDSRSTPDLTEVSTAWDGNRAPWVLGKICRSWRESALSLPRLWNSFNFDVAIAKAYREDLPELCALQLERCVDQFINVQLGRLPCRNPALAERVLSVLCGQNRAALWGSASINWEQETLVLLLPFSGLFRSLRELHLYASPCMMQPSEPNSSPYVIFRNTPCLRTVSMFGNNGSTEKIVLPWAQITQYTARAFRKNYTPNFHYIVLPKLDNLQVCWLDCGPTYQHVSAPSLVLSRLHTLIINTNDHLTYTVPSGVSEFFISTSLPALRVLKVRNGLHKCSRSLANCISRSRCSLRELTLFNLLNPDQEDLSHLLLSGSLNDLEVLTVGTQQLSRWFINIYGLKAQTHLLNLLQVDPERLAAVPLPNLRSFRTVFYEDCKAEVESMVRSRWFAKEDAHPPSRSLERLVILRRPHVPPGSKRNTTSDAIERLQDVCAEGFEVCWEEMVF